VSSVGQLQHAQEEISILPLLDILAAALGEMTCELLSQGMIGINADRLQVTEPGSEQNNRW